MGQPKRAFSLRAAIVSVLTLALLAPFAAAKPMTFDIVYVNQSNFVVADGEITKDTPAAFQAFLDSEPFDGFWIYIDLNSDGGNLLAGMKLGEMIRELGLTTRVVSYLRNDLRNDVMFPREYPGRCFSACALAFLGGELREIPTDSQIGFHQFSSSTSIAQSLSTLSDTESATQYAAGMVHAYVQSMGVSSSLFTRLIQTPPNEMFVPSRDELREFSIISQESFHDFVLLPSGKGVVATATFEANAQGRNIVSKVTAFCRDGEPFLLLSQPDHYRPRGDDWLRSLNTSLNGFALYDPKSMKEIEYPKSSVTPLIRGSDVAELRLDDEGAAMVVNGTNGSVYIAAFVLMQFSIEPTSSDKDALRASFHLCER
jgi:hypothetical protein